MNNKKRLGFLFIPLILIIILTFLFLFPKKSSFRQYCDTFFSEQLSNDTLSLHYTLANPSQYGIDTDQVSLPLYNSKEVLNSYKTLHHHLSALQAFDAETLSKEEKTTHQLLCAALSHEVKSQNYHYLQEVFSPAGGAQLQFPILMAEYPFRCKKDVEDYLELLKLSPSYFDSLCQFESEKFSRGFGMADVSLNKVIEQCHSIMNKEALEKEKHFLITTFSERINEALSKKYITKKEAEAFLALNKQYLTDYTLPAYESLANTLSSFLGQGRNENGLCFFPDGKAYYEWLFKTSTGSDVPIKDAYQALAKDYHNTLLHLNEKLTAFRSDCLLSAEELSYFPLSSSEEMLADLQTRITSDFPTITSVFGVPALPAAIKKVCPALEEFSAPAYYMVPPIDDNSSNSIYINHQSAPKGIDLYTTLAHEGYPGHLYQTTYFQTYSRKNNLPLIRNTLNYIGYVEGWALYTEFLSFDYAADLAVTKTGKEDYRLLYEIYALERRASLAMLTLLDIGIHYYGMDLERTEELLNAHGITNPEQIREIFEYITEEPCNYAKYYWGYMEILSLKETAKKQMGEYYSDYAFHQFYLECGPSDFTTLNKMLKEE